MQVKMMVVKSFNLYAIQVMAKVRYWENSKVNGEYDTPNGDNIPCKFGKQWCPEIDVETGKILNWKQGVTAEIHYKVCDRFSYALIDNAGFEVYVSPDDYVPNTFAINEDGYGDYIIMSINENGFIKDWKFRIEDFNLFV